VSETAAISNSSTIYITSKSIKFYYTSLYGKLKYSKQALETHFCDEKKDALTTGATSILYALHVPSKDIISSLEENYEKAPYHGAVQ